MSWYRDVPKVELHVHLEGAIPHAALFELVQKYGGDPAVPDVSALEKLEETGYISSVLSEPVKKKGGKAIKYYSVTENGVTALKTVRSSQDALWDGLYEKIFSR